MLRKTAELTGAALDWAVSVAGEFETGGHRPRIGFTDNPHNEHKTQCVRHQVKNVSWFADYRFNPSECWLYGGPIIDRERIELGPAHSAWRAVPNRTMYPNNDAPWHFGPTPLIAAMRCFVASKLGAEVDIPDGL